MKPLKGVRVVDLTRHLPGPFATHLLASLGAEVIKVELPQMADPARKMPPGGALYALSNGGKKSLCLDFSKPEGRAALLKLVGKSRVLIEGFRPGLLDRLELGYPALKKKFPGLIYCSITGYGQTGPRARWSGHDLNYEAMSGILSQSGELPPVPIADFAGSFYAAFTVAAALRSARGAHLDISMTKTAASLLHFPAGEFQGAGRSAGKGEGWWNGAHPFYALYGCADGRRVAVAALEKGYALRLLQLLGRADLEALADEPMENAAALRDELALEFARRPLSHWESLAGKEACLTPVRDCAEAFAENGGATPADFPIRAPGAKAGTPRKAPALGQDGRSVLRACGCTPAEIKSLLKKRILAV